VSRSQIFRAAGAFIAFIASIAFIAFIASEQWCWSIRRKKVE
jgi:hypothetical protein